MFAVLLAQRDEDARVHAQVAIKEGAICEELLDTAKLVGWLAGAPVLNLGLRLVGEVWDRPNGS
jgi:alkylhydroperoxidase/carboxymuconolactone decarboxylase family protein YurZ